MDRGYESQGGDVERAPLVSVLMNCLNGEQYLHEALESVYGQTFHDWEIVFWDNASTDRSGNLAQSYGKKVRYFRAPETSALGKARNFAIQKARGRYIAILDTDDTWHPTKLEEQVILMDREPDAGLCYTDAVWTDESSKSIQLKSFHRVLPSGRIYEQLILDDFITCSSAMISADSLSFAGGFGEHYQYVEELDLWLHIASKFKIVCVPKPLTYVRIHANNISRNVIAALQEYQELIGSIQSEERNIQQACRRKIRELEIRSNIVELVKNPGGRSRHFLLLVKTMLFCIVSPRIMYTLVRRFGNRKSLATFRKKYGV
jgi:glycosyltransferase involved in cell wall biosynthesis